MKLITIILINRIIVLKSRICIASYTLKTGWVVIVYQNDIQNCYWNAE